MKHLWKFIAASNIKAKEKISWQIFFNIIAINLMEIISDI